MEPLRAKRLRTLEDENANLKKLITEHILDRAKCGVIGSSPMAGAMLRNINLKTWLRTK
jgi:hypothetical protein